MLPDILKFTLLYLNFIDRKIHMTWAYDGFHDTSHYIGAKLCVKVKVETFNDYYITLFTTEEQIGAIAYVL